MDVPPSPPQAALTALVPPDVDLAAGWRHEAATPVWYGVVWGRLGHGELAWAHFDRIRLRSLQPWIAAERGRLLREHGCYLDAEALEWPALLVADDAVDAAMLRISLAADAVGKGEPALARRRLAGATEAVRDLHDGPRAARQRLRLTWVGVEVVSLDGGTPDPTGLPVWDPEVAAPDLPPDHGWGSDFHRAKGLLFGGVVRRDLRLLDVAARLAPAGLLWAVHAARADLGVAGARAEADAARRAVIAPPAMPCSAGQDAPSGS